MTHVLKNKHFELRIELPAEHYRAARFDWTGKIAAVIYKGIPLTGSEILDDPEPSLHGRGLYNEFGIDAPLGYEEIEAGDWFHKIGVGLLKKAGFAYHFHQAYETQAAQFATVLDADSLRVTCQAPLVNGYAYYLEKTFNLFEGGFSIQYALENQGHKPILTNEYNHNFLSLGRDLTGSDYVLRFPFPIKPASFGESVNPEQVVAFGQGEIRFLSTPQQPFFFSQLSGGERIAASWQLEHTRCKIGISETGDFLTDAVNLWGCGHVISPELFIQLDIAPGQSRQWSRTYEVYEWG